MELLNPLAVLLEGLSFNLCVAPFLNVCVLDFTSGLRMEIGQRLLELGWRCHTRDGQEKTKSEETVRMKTSED